MHVYQLSLEVLNGLLSPLVTFSLSFLCEDENRSSDGQGLIARSIHGLNNVPSSSSCARLISIPASMGYSIV